MHSEQQDTNFEAWKRLLDLVEQAAEDGREEFTPLHELDQKYRKQIITLPLTIAKLKKISTLSSMEAFWFIYHLKSGR